MDICLLLNISTHIYIAGSLSIIFLFIFHIPGYFLYFKKDNTLKNYNSIILKVSTLDTGRPLERSESITTI